MWETIFLYLENPNIELAKKSSNQMKIALKNYRIEWIRHPDEVRPLSITDQQKLRIIKIYGENLF